MAGKKAINYTVKGRELRASLGDDLNRIFYTTRDIDREVLYLRVCRADQMPEHGERASNESDAAKIALKIIDDGYEGDLIVFYTYKP